MKMCPYVYMADTSLDDDIGHTESKLSITLPLLSLSFARKDSCCQQAHYYYYYYYNTRHIRRVYISYCDDDDGKNHRKTLCLQQTQLESFPFILNDESPPNTTNSPRRARQSWQ